MAIKRKDYYPHEFPNINDDPSLYVDRNEIMRLTKMAKAWEFTCSFCFKKFPSAQAMGGHQNAHRQQRMEEKRLYIRDPIGYRKRAYIKAMKEAAEQSSTVDQGGQNPSPNLHAAKEVAKYEFVNINGPPEILQRPFIDVVEFNAVVARGNNNNNSYFCQPSRINGENRRTKTLPFVVMNFLPPKELSLAESVGVYAEDGKGKGCMEFNVGGYGMDFDHKLDLTLKL